MTAWGWYVHMQNQANDSIFLSHIIYGLNAIFIFYCTTTHLLLAASSAKAHLFTGFFCHTSIIVVTLKHQFPYGLVSVHFDNQRRVHDNRYYTFPKFTMVEASFM